MYKYFKNYGDKVFSYHKEDDHEINVIQFEEYFSHNDVVYDFLYCDVTDKLVFQLKNLVDCCDDLDVPLYLVIKWVA